MSPWARGAEEVRTLLERGELQRVVPSEQLAERLYDEGRASIESAQMILPTNPGGALQLAYESARKAATALLAAQGLRPTTRG